MEIKAVHIAAVWLLPGGDWLNKRSLGFAPRSHYYLHYKQVIDHVVVFVNASKEVYAFLIDEVLGLAPVDGQGQVMIAQTPIWQESRLVEN